MAAAGAPKLKAGKTLPPPNREFADTAGALKEEAAEAGSLTNELAAADDVAPKRGISGGSVGRVGTVVGVGSQHAKALGAGAVADGVGACADEGADVGANCGTKAAEADDEPTLNKNDDAEVVDDRALPHVVPDSAGFLSGPSGSFMREKGACPTAKLVLAEALWPGSITFPTDRALTSREGSAEEVSTTAAAGAAS